MNSVFHVKTSQSAKNWLDSSPNSEATETATEYDLEVKDQGDPYQTEQREVYADKPLADEEC